MGLGELVFAAMLFAMLGVGGGVLTGLIPGLHVNTVSALLIAFSSSVVGFSQFLLGSMNPTNYESILMIACFIIGMMITHSFLDIIPSIFLGAPEPETALSVLPGHVMMMEGRGYEAIKYSAFGSLAGMLICLFMLVPARLFMGSPFTAYEAIYPFIAYILLFIVVLMFMEEGASSKEAERFGGRMALNARAYNIGPGYGDGMDIPFSELTHHINEEAQISGELVARDGSLLVLQDEFDGSKCQIHVSGKEKMLDFDIGDKLQVTGIVTARPSGKLHARQKILALTIFLGAGGLGILVLQGPIENFNWYPVESLHLEDMMLFPLFTGLFGFSSLFMSLATNPEMPSQECDGITLDMPIIRRFRGAFGGTFAGALVGFFPGVSSGVATVVAKSALGGGEDRDSQKEYIIAISGVNTANALFGLVALFVIMKARSGAMVAVLDLMEGNVQGWEPYGTVPFLFGLLLLAAGLAAAMAFFLTLFFGKLFAKVYNRIPYKKMTWSIIIFLTCLIFLFTGPMGLAVAALSTLMGIVPQVTGVKRIHLMGVLMVPIIFYFLDIMDPLMEYIGWM